MGQGRALGSLLLVFALALVASCSRPAPVKSGRPKLVAGGVTWQVLGGTWKKDGDSLVGTGGHVQSLRDLTDGTFEVDVEADAPSDQILGIGFRCAFTDDDPSHGAGYGLHYTSRGFNVLRGANDYWQPVNPDVKGFSPSSILDGRKNHFVLRLAGSSFQIDANGSSLFDFEDATHAHGHVDLWVESKTQKVRFSNLRMTP